MDDEFAHDGDEGVAGFSATGGYQPTTLPGSQPREFGDMIMTSLLQATPVCMQQSVPFTYEVERISVMAVQTP